MSRNATSTKIKKEFWLNSWLKLRLLLKISTKNRLMSFFFSCFLTANNKDLSVVSMWVYFSSTISLQAFSKWKNSDCEIALFHPWQIIEKNILNTNKNFFCDRIMRNLQVCKLVGSSPIIPCTFSFTFSFSTCLHYISRALSITLLHAESFIFFSSNLMREKNF